MRPSRVVQVNAKVLCLGVLLLGASLLVAIPPGASAIGATLQVEVNEIHYIDEMETLGLPPDWYFRVNVQDASGTETQYSSIPIAPLTYDIVPVPSSEFKTFSVTVNDPTDAIVVVIELWDYDGVLGGSPDPSDDSADISGEPGGGFDDTGGQSAPAGASLSLRYHILRPGTETDHGYEDESGTWYDGCAAHAYSGESAPDSSTGVDENDAAVTITICDDYVDTQGPPAPAPDDGVSGCSSDATPSFTWNPPSDPSGIDGYSFAVDASPDPTVDTSGTFTTLPAQTDGTHTFYVKALDHAGNWGPAGGHGFQVDTTAPVTPVPDDGVSGWSSDNTPTFTWAPPSDACGVAGYSWSVDSPPDASMDTSLTTLTLAPQPDGTHTFSVRARDQAGNWGSPGQHGFQIDTVAPSLDSVSWDSPSTDNTPTFSWVAGDALSGIAGYSYEVDAPPDASIDTSLTGIELVVQPDGPHRFNVTARDNAGNWGSVASAPFLIDTTAPATPVPDDGVSGWSTDNTPTFSWAPVTDPNGIGGYSYATDVAPDFTIDTTGTSVTLPPQPDGAHVFRVMARDMPGNWGSEGSHAFQVDTTEPGVPNPDDGVSGWSSDSTPTFTWSPPPDAHSGVSCYAFVVDAAPGMTCEIVDPIATLLPQSDGMHQFFVRARDNAGNWGVAGQHDFMIDTTGPSSPNPDDGISGWSANATRLFSWPLISDPNGVAGYSYAVDAAPDEAINTLEGFVLLPSQPDGRHDFCVMARDEPGNWGPAGCHEFLIDTTAPGPISPDDSVASWSSDSTPTFTWSPPPDAHSGVSCYAFAVDALPTTTCQIGDLTVTLLPQADGNHTFYVRARDLAENWGLAGQHEFWIDALAPPPPSPDDGVAGWTTDDTPTFAWPVPPDADSGVSCYAFAVDAQPAAACDIAFESIELPPQSDGGHIFHVRARDGAGNWGPAGQHGFWIDTNAPPEPDPDDGITGWSPNPSPQFTWSPPIDLSGIGGYSFAADAPPDDVVDGTSPTITIAPVQDGLHSFNVKAVDLAGNWGAAGVHEFRVDSTPPQSAVAALDLVQTSPNFAVFWSGSDGVDRSGLQSYDVQYRDGATGIWTDWVTLTAETVATFSGLDGRTYYFRSRGVDNAGNSEPYPVDDGDASTTVQFPPDRGAVQGHVYDEATSAPLAGAIVRLGSQATVATDASGAYSASVPPGTYVVSASKAGHAMSSASVTVAKDQTITQDFRLAPLPGWIVGTVTDGDSGLPLQGAQIEGGGQDAVSSASGQFNVTLPAGTWIVTCWLQGYRPATATVPVSAGAETTQDFQPSRVPVESLGTLVGHVFVKDTAQPVGDAVVEVEGVGRVSTSASGAYEVLLERGTYLVRVSKDGYEPASRSVIAIAQSTVVADFELAPIVVRDQPTEAGNPLLPWAAVFLTATILALFAIGAVRRSRRRRPGATPHPTREGRQTPPALAVKRACPFCGNGVEMGRARCPVCGGALK